MGILIAAVVLLTALTLFNLLLTMALVRRLRQLETPARSDMSPPSPDLDDVPAGTPVPEFTAHSTGGAALSSADRRGDTALYAFFDTACGTCKKQLRPLVDYARRTGLSPDQVIAFIGDPLGEAESYTSVLDGHVTVVMQAVHDQVGEAFSLTGIPAFVLADARGVVVRSGVTVESLDTAPVGV